MAVDMEKLLKIDTAQIKVQFKFTHILKALPTHLPTNTADQQPDPASGPHMDL